MELVILAFAFLGLATSTEATYRALDTMIGSQNQPLSSKASVPGTFLLYRAAILSFVDAHPGFTGSVAATDLGFTDAQIAALAGGGNEVIRSGNGTTIQTWVPMSASDIERAVATSQGDMAIGTSQGTTWTSPIAGDMGALPVAVASGDAVSVVTLTGSGF
ncbi:hypothetical protein JK182_01660 [Acetobacter okinawensis]|uniref:type IV pilus biogenesis protein PilM n=1 Tax=Acetobacter okinawensis TaxID=1076594 RepID=UPI001BAA882F|nr:hypothetical protein [Acetobacter okinawensis]MBS0987399.1 hypothetical protein [Acetobacter okinawensis]